MHRIFLVGAALCVPAYATLLFLTGNQMWIAVGVLSGLALWVTAVLWKELK